MSDSMDVAGEQLRASKLIARIGLGEREYYKKIGFLLDCKNKTVIRMNLDLIKRIICWSLHEKCHVRWS